MKRFLLYIWQLPQNLLGLLIVSILKGRKDEWDGLTYYDAHLRGGVSLGEYVIIDRRYYNDSKTIHHEHGHQRQSMYLGWLYLLTIGLPSVTGNLVFRIPAVKARWDYYGQPWEAWADKLGGVIR